MSQLTWATIPGAVDLPDANLAADQPLTDYSLTKISNNAKFAAVRVETFYGWYKHGEFVAIPTSPVDGYAYSRQELSYDIAAFCTRPPIGSTNGAQAIPQMGPQSGGGTLLWTRFWVDEKNEASPGLVHCEVSYYEQDQPGPDEVQTNDGFVKVRVIATRLSG